MLALNARVRNGGFSMVELMVGLVAGMVVLGALLAFTVTSVRANSDYVAAARLSQELRTVGQHISDELRRAGYDESALDYVATPSATEFSRFAPVLVDTSDPSGHCIVYAYDRSPGNPGQIDLANQEVRAIRRSTATIDGETVGVIEAGESSAGGAPSCDGASPDYSKYPVPCAASGWCALSDPRAIDIEAFVVNASGLVDSDGDGAADAPDQSSHGLQTITATGYTPMQIREIKFSLTGHLRNDAATSRTVSSNVKVRANCLRALVDDCSEAPVP